MNISFARNCRLAALALVSPVLALCAVSAAAQGVQTVDPDAVIDADLLDNGDATASGGGLDSGYAFEEATPRYETVPETVPETARPVLDLPQENYPTTAATDPQETIDTAPPPAAEQQAATYAEDDLIGAAEGLFGQGAEGLARLIQDVLADQGEPNGYIVGREAGGAFVLGVRYGSGTLFHAVEGNMPVYWTGPSIGLDAGANAGNTFVLVYNLHDTEDLYKRFPAGEGQAYFVGGFTASYVRRGDVVMIPIRVGAGLRLGVNAGYMRFTREQTWLPF